jgi:hypothetical protein
VVYFRLIAQGLRYGPGTHSQGIGYDQYSNRLVFVADGCIISVPVNKLGALTKADVKQTQFKTKREFESVIFDAKGRGYLLTNRNPETLRSTKAMYEKYDWTTYEAEQTALLEQYKASMAAYEASIVAWNKWWDDYDNRANIDGGLTMAEFKNKYPQPANPENLPPQPPAGLDISYFSQVPPVTVKAKFQG